MKLHRMFPPLFVGVCLFCGTTVVCAQPPEAPPVIFDEEGVRPVNATPHTAIESFVHFYNSSQWGNLRDLVFEAELDDAALAEVVETIDKARGTLRLRVADIQLEQAEDEITAMVTVHALDDLGMGMSWHETLKLHRQIEHQQEIWKLRPGAPRVIDRHAFDGYLQRLITLIAYPKKTLALQRQRGQRESAMQMKQLALGVKQFIQDHDEKYAFTPETIKARIRPYIKNDSLWTAPGDAAGTMSYSFNPKLSNVNEANLNWIADTVLFYLGRDGKLDFRYDGKTVVGFTDGHVMFLTEEEAKKLRWDP